MPFNADPYISKTPGFPKEGITFYDISPILEDSVVVRQAMDALADLARPMQPDIIAGVDARGFLFALPLALSLDCGMVMLRKAGKLPGELFEQSYALEYGEARLSIQASRQLRGRRVVLCDDLLATGGTLEAAAGLGGIRSAQGLPHCLRYRRPRTVRRIVAGAARARPGAGEARLQRA